MPEYAPPAVGREGVRKAYEWVFATLKLNGRFIVHEAEVIGDTAWVRTNSTGRFTIIATGFEADVANSEFLSVQAREWRMENSSLHIHRLRPPAEDLILKTNRENDDRMHGYSACPKSRRLILPERES